MNKFEVYTLINQDSVWGYGIVAISHELRKIINVSDTHFSIDDFSDEVLSYLQEDYNITMSNVPIDYLKLFNVITRQFEDELNGIIIYFNKKEQVERVVLVFERYETYYEIIYEFKNETLVIEKKWDKILYKGKDINQYNFSQITIEGINIKNAFTI